MLVIVVSSANLVDLDVTSRGVNDEQKLLDLCISLSLQRWNAPAVLTNFNTYS